ncbi:hypothetical protein HHL16_23500 [Pseudoflavitalea sp. G-6-1-2]|uniref:hypothetical protein n=1 Tax=Pseudoflavitalea sp. G-6-1-2 TaxID=2728841 RepID=UPI001469F48D|nr:hypothetical protein [Pseudoflavitalea sp. G-6-1-2]NML23866.1 hypothetical protein [Pseudoflavitalea sp. G-6-1-2]
MITLNKTCLILATVLALAGCNKNVDPRDESIDPVTTGLAYVNASEDITRQIKDDAGAKSIVLLDNTDTTFGRVPDIRKPLFPIFTQYSPLQYPSQTGNIRLEQPWLRYDAVSAGNHQLILMDTAHNPVLKQQISLESKNKATIYYSDVLGKYSSLVLKDTLDNKPGYAGIRFVNFCGDADISFTINKEKKAGFPASMKHGQYSSLVQLPSTGSDTFRIRLYRTDDPENIIARATLYTEPGHGYTVLITGYTQEQSYKAPYGNSWVTIPAYPRIKLYKNY